MRLHKRAHDCAIPNMLKKIKDFLKNSTAVKAMCNRYGVNTDKIEQAPIHFAPLPVSAKTKNKTIIINTAFLKDKEFSKNMHYIVHELCHWLQQTQNDPHDLIPKKYEIVDYLDIPSEHEAFIFQINFMKEMYGEKEAEKYVDELLDFHELEGKKRKDKKRQLLSPATPDLAKP